MEFTANRKDLLALAKKAMMLANHSPHEVLRGIYLESDEDNQEMSMIATNIEAVIFLKEKASVTKSGRLVVNAKLLSDMLAVLAGEDVAFSSDRDNYLKVSSGTCVYRIACLPGKDYPMPAMAFPGESVKLTGICGMAKKTVFAVSTDNNKPALQCVCVKVKDNSAHAAACDGVRMILVKGGAESSGENEFLLPAKPFQILASISSDEDVFDVGTVGNETVFTKKNLLFSIKKASGVFIDTNQIVQSIKPVCSAIVNAEQMRQALELVLIGADGTPVNLAFVREALQISRSGESNVSMTETPAKLAGEMPKKGFYYNLDFLTKLFQVLAGKVKLGFDERGMMLVRAANEVYFQAPINVARTKKKPAKKQADKNERTEAA